MRFGAHLPIMDFGDQRYAVDHLVNYVETATAGGFDALSVNDHFVFGAPWLDGLTAPDRRTATMRAWGWSPSTNDGLVSTGRTPVIGRPIEDLRERLAFGSARAVVMAPLRA